MDSFSCASCERISGDLSDSLEKVNIASLCQECGRKPPRKVSIVHTKEKFPHEVSLVQGDEKFPRNLDVVQSKDKSSSTATLTHTESFDNDKRFACDTCGKKFTEKYNLVVHFRIHTGEKDYACNVCGKKFRHKNTLKCHLRVHTGEKNYECHICKKKFTYKSGLRDHLSLHSASTGQKFPCEVCQKLFITKRYLVRHKRRNACSAEDRVSNCRKKVDWKETFAKCVMPMPSGRKGYICLICGKQYLQRSCMRNHIRFHTRENVYKCEYCGKEFQEKKYLRIHITIHTGDRQHLCTVCGKRYSQNSHLRAHMRNHTGEKKFHCGECGESFGLKAELRRHMLKHTGDDGDICLCEICGKQYVDKYSFARHKKSHKVEQKCLRSEGGCKKVLENDLVKYDICEMFTEKRLVAEHRKHHSKQELKPCALRIVKSEFISGDFIPNDKGLTFNDLTDSTDYIKTEAQYSDDENLLFENSYQVKVEEEDELG
ncbi:gastrula zinc finger protein XlCGF26.1-like isoform X1 [Macrobrachium nipponense]|uniref:gastrula zinc finger protein XlCGF26.1-like isoform X1 n=1 Tax=Macrobrachium nipponense TaxID=159736 RepID=UPI0030C7E6C9